MYYKIIHFESKSMFQLLFFRKLQGKGSSEFFKLVLSFELQTQITFAYSNSATENIEKGVKYLQS